MYTLLNLIGVPDTHRLLVTGNPYGDINRLSISMLGTNSLEALFDASRLQHTTITLGGIHPKMPNIAPHDVILNTICDPDTNAEALRHAEKVIASFPDTPVANHPAKIFQTTRDAIYERLHEIRGVTVPKTVRIAPRRLDQIPDMVAAHGITCPYIFRSTGDHGGKGMVLVQSEADLPQLEAFPFDGRDFYVIAFHDFQSDDGRYRKTRLVVIDGSVYPRHRIISDHWMIHAQSRNGLMTREKRYQEEEEAFHNNPPLFVQPVISDIYRELELDFFGIDCHIDDNGHMLIFEINTCMRLVADTPTGYHVKPTERIRDALNTMILEKITT